MLSQRPPRARARLGARRGFTLAELVVALGVGGVACGAFALILAQQERAHAELARRIRARAQLREGLSALVGELRALSPAAGDIAAGEARDSSIQFRSTIGTAVVCQVRDQVVASALASFVTPVDAGDTVWAYVRREGAPVWAPLSIARALAQADAGPHPCPFPAEARTVIDPRIASRVRHSLVLAEMPSLALPTGTPLRVTRPVRYSLYRAPDRRWHLGRREWSSARNRFESIQPVSGPYREYAAPVSAASGLELRYFDSDHTELSAGAIETTRISQVGITLRSLPPPSDDRTRDRRDIASVSVAIRNRP